MPAGPNKLHRLVLDSYPVRLHARSLWWVMYFAYHVNRHVGVIPEHEEATCRVVHFQCRWVDPVNCFDWGANSVKYCLLCNYYHGAVCTGDRDETDDTALSVSYGATIVGIALYWYFHSLGYTIHHCHILDSSGRYSITPLSFFPVSFGLLALSGCQGFPWCASKSPLTVNKTKLSLLWQ